MEIPHGHYIDVDRVCKSPIFMDAGACIGRASGELFRLFPNAMIYMIEPNPSNFSRLRESFQQQENARLISAALIGGDFDITTSFTEFIGLPEWGNLFGLYRESARLRSKECINYSVPTIQLSSLIDQIGRIDYLKADIEGMEYSIFETLGVKYASSIGQISMEMHVIPEHTKESLIGQFKLWGFEVQIFNEFELYAYHPDWI